MKIFAKRKHAFRPARSERGIALILTLSLLLIVTVIVVAFFFRSRFDTQGTASYSNQVSSQELAKAGASQAVAYLQAETEKTADKVLPDGTSGTSHFFVVTTPKNMLPLVEVAPEINPSSAQNAPDGDFSNLIKQSGRLNGNLKPKASGVATNKVSLDGRKLDGKFWSKPLLTKIDFADTAVPQWIYIAANGQPVTQQGDNENRIVGRYAFNVYDVGGLLDMNAAGFTSDTDNAKIAAGQKGSLIFADLASLAQSVGASLDATQITALNQWRYSPDLKWDIKPNTAGALSDSLLDLTRSGPMFASLGKFPVGLETGHSRQNQNAFLSRQDMLRYFASVLDPGDAKMTNTRKLLPYLTHFTRDVNKPYFVWDWDAGRPTAVATSKLGFSSSSNVTGNQKSINALPYNDDGTERIVRRFPLSRLDLLKLDQSGNPNSANKDLIQRYFGLTWDTSGDHPHWKYDPIAKGSPIPLRYLSNISAADVEKDPRKEPNFFELLFAAINSGSLGQQLGGVAGGMRPHTFGQDDSFIDRHVMRIGAAIIDQWDSDGWPTEIEYDGQTIFGVEDLPYLHGFKKINYFSASSPPYSITFNGADGGPNGQVPMVEAATMMHPQVWNPNSRQSGAVASGYKPVDFRVVPYTNTMSGINNPLTDTPNFGYGTDFGRRPRLTGYANRAANGSYRYYDLLNTPIDSDKKTIAVSSMSVGPQDWTSLNPILDQNTDAILFSDNLNGDTFREPILLWKPTSKSPYSNQSATVTTSMAGTTNGSFKATDLAFIDPDAHGTQEYVGFRLGRYLACAQSVSGHAVSEGYYGIHQAALIAIREFTPNSVRVNYALQYKHADGSWRTYDVMYDTVNFDSSDSNRYPPNNDEKTWRIMEREADATFRTDPRVERFGPQSQWYKINNPSDPKVVTKFPANSTGWADGATVKTTATADTSGTSAWYYYTLSRGTSSDVRYEAYNSAPFADNGSGNLNNTQLWKYRISSFAFSPDSKSGLQWPYLKENTSGNQLLSLTSLFPMAYKDPDQQLRYAAGGWNNGSKDGNPMMPNNDAARPVILNRPFQSVAEMGYASRDLPWKSLDFWDSNSGDTALLDYFCLNEVDSDPFGKQVSAGVLNLNSANPKVLASLIAGSRLKPDATPGGEITADDASAIADQFAAWVRSTDPMQGPFRSRGEIVGKYVPGGYVGPFTGKFLIPTPTDGKPIDVGGSNVIRQRLNADSPYEARRTNLMRALVDATTVRTWNLMIDVTAQTGKVKNGSSSIDQFVVDGQTRQWIFVAIDRMTGKILDEKIETTD